MEAVIAVTAGVIVFVQAWRFFGLAVNKATQIVGMARAILLAGLAALNPLPLLTASSLPAVATSTAIYAVYAALVAGVDTESLEARGLGLLALFGCAFSIGQIVYCIVTVSSLVGMLCGITQTTVFAMLFLHLGVPIAPLKKLTAWVLLAGGLVHGSLAGLILSMYGLWQALIRLPLGSVASQPMRKPSWPAWPLP